MHIGESRYKLRPQVLIDALIVHVDSSFRVPDFDKLFDYEISDRFAMADSFLR
jgi:hypothetical protein